MRIVVKQDVYQQILLLPQVQAELDRRGQAIADACGEGFEYRRGTRYRRRDRGMVIAATRHARYKNAKHMTILKNIGAGRG